MTDKPYNKRLFAQGTPGWKRWRKEGIGASDAPIIMKQSPWTTSDDLLLLKSGIKRERTPNSAMRRGRGLEPVARQKYIEKVGTKVFPECLESRHYPWMRASIDGMSLDGRLIVEIKCPGIQDHSIALKGQVPPKYYPQLQHILAVTGLEAIDYWSYRDNEGILLFVPRNDRYISDLINKEDAFWQRVQASPRIGSKESIGAVRAPTPKRNGTWSDHETRQDCQKKRERNILWAVVSFIGILLLLVFHILSFIFCISVTGTSKKQRRKRRY